MPGDMRWGSGSAWSPSIFASPGPPVRPIVCRPWGSDRCLHPRRDPGPPARRSPRLVPARPRDGGHLGGDCWPRLELIPPHGPCSPSPPPPWPTWRATCASSPPPLGSGGTRPRPRREDEADAAIITLGALAIWWQFLMGSYVGNSSLSPGAGWPCCPVPSLASSCSSSCDPWSSAGSTARSAPPGHWAVPRRRVGLRRGIGGAPWFPRAACRGRLPARVRAHRCGRPPSVHRRGRHRQAEAGANIYRREPNGRDGCRPSPLPASCRRASC